jgi:hypothetical protein
MILPGLLIALFLLVLSYATAAYTAGGRTQDQAFVDVPALLCLLLPLLGYVLVCGYKPLWTGLSAILRRPAQSQTDVANYFRNLTICILAFGIVVPMTLSCLCLYPLGDLEIRKQMLPTAMLLFFYSGWLALLVSVPIASRFSGGDLGFSLRRFLPVAALLGCCFLFPVFTGTCLLWLNVLPMDMLRQINDCVDTANLLHFLVFFCDFPSFSAVLGMLIACRLAMGKLQNRYDWIPICVLIGVLWSLLGISVMLTDLKPEMFLIGCMVSAITTLYAFIFAIAILVNRSWFFTITGAVLAVCIGISEIVSPRFFTTLIEFVIVIAFCCVVGRFCDLCYLAVTRYESFGDMFRKHKVYWGIVLLLILLVILSVFVWLLWGNPIRF